MRINQWHSQSRRFSHRRGTIPVSSFPILEFRHSVFSPISVSSGRATTPSGARLVWAVSSPQSLCSTTIHSRNPPALALLTGAKVVRSSSGFFVGSPPIRIFAVFRIGQRSCPSTFLTPNTPLHPHPGRPPRDRLTPRRPMLTISFHFLTLLFRHFPLVTCFIPMVARLPCPCCGVLLTFIVTVAGVFTTASLSLSPSLSSLFLVLVRPPRTCSGSGFSFPSQCNCFVGLLHSLHQSEFSFHSRCQRPQCLEHALPDCPTRFCNLQSTNIRCVLLCTWRETARGWLAEERRHRDSPLFSFMHSVWVNANCRHVWGRDGSTLPLLRPYRWDSCITVSSWALFVSAHSTPHVGVAIDTRTKFWVLACSFSRSYFISQGTVNI